MRIFRPRSERDCETAPPALFRNGTRGCESASGFTLVELLVVIAIVGVLVGLLLPAVQAAREAARQTSCKNNLRQLAFAILEHETAHQHLPTGGWGYLWVGDPERGFGRRQPGGWAYNILPFLELQNLHQLGNNEADHEDKLSAGTQQMQTTVGIFHCPSRRGAELYPYGDELMPYNTNQGAERVTAQTDYAMNGGSVAVLIEPGPPSLEDGDDPNYAWPDIGAFRTGLVHVRSAVRLNEIEDGTTHTYLVGEKYIDPDKYTTGESWGDDNGVFCGYDWDSVRWGRLEFPPLRDESGTAAPTRFGSAHPAAWHAALCDGSVSSFSYDIEPKLHLQMSNRRDGGTADDGVP